jgi:hypothetical protein
MREELGPELKNKNYNIIPYDANKTEEDDKSDFGTDERRAWILEKYMNGDLKDMNKKELASTFGILRKQLYKDMNVVRLWVRENPDQAMVDDTIQRQNEAVNKLLEKEEYYKAGKLNENLLEVLQEAGLIEKQADKVEVENMPDSMAFNVVQNTEDDESDTGDDE